MLAAIFRWFENRLDTFAPAPIAQPPTRLAAFYWHFVKPVWPVFAIMLSMSFALALIEVAIAAFLGRLIDLMKASTSPSAFLAEHAVLLVTMTLIVAVARPLVSVIYDLVKHQTMTSPFQGRVRWRTHTYVLRQSLGYFQNDFAGRIANRIMQTAPAIRDSVTQLIDATVYVGVQWLGAVVLFAGADPRLVLPLLVWLVAYAGALLYFVPRIRKSSTAASAARSMLLGRIVDSYTNILTVKLFAHAEREDAYARGALEEQIAKWQVSLRLMTLMDLVLYVLNGLLIASSMGLAVWLWSLGSVSIGAIAVVATLVIRIVHMSGWVMWLVAGIFDNIGVVAEGMETISRPHDVVDVPGAKALVVPKGEIRIENLHFRYTPRTPVADDGEEGDETNPAKALKPPQVSLIENLNLVIRAGEKVGVVGRSGAGKSTLVNLLLRFYDLESGRILIDGQDIAKVSQESLRTNIGLVTQDTSLLHRSVRDNILYGRPDAGDAAAELAARRAHAHDFIADLQDGKGRQGYLAHVGERGVKLSGGQRQRIAMARVLLKDAPILILDEATSALDSEVESAIQEQLTSLMAGKTVIAIAHRLSTIAAMDRLIVMDKGRIVEDGSHAELLRRGGIYSELWRRQSGGFLIKEAAE